MKYPQNQCFALSVLLRQNVPRPKILLRQNSQNADNQHIHNFCLSKIPKSTFCLSKICKSLKFKILFRRFCLGKILPRACAHNAPARVYIHTILRVVVKEYMYIKIGGVGERTKQGNTRKCCPILIHQTSCRCRSRAIWRLLRSRLSSAGATKLETIPYLNPFDWR